VVAIFGSSGKILPSVGSWMELRRVGDPLVVNFLTWISCSKIIRSQFCGRAVAFRLE